MLYKILIFLFVSYLILGCGKEEVENPMPLILGYPAPVDDGLPPVEGNFLEIATNPNANSLINLNSFATKV